jgi:hypothetical protein
MSTTSLVNSLYQANTTALASTQKDSSGSVDFANTLSAALSGANESSSWLLDSSAVVGTNRRPDTKEFMDKTGASWDEAMVLYSDDGRDTRDWTKIMSASDPLATAREATAQMYNDPSRQKTVGFVPSESDVYAKTQNFTYYNVGDGVDRLAFTDKNGVILRQLTGDAKSLKTEILNFGFDATQLQVLQQKLENKGVAPPLFGDKEKNVFLDINGLTSYVAGNTPTSAFVVSSVNKYAAQRPQLNYAGVDYPDDKVTQLVNNTTGQVSNFVNSKEMTQTQNTTSKLTTELQKLYEKHFGRSADTDGLAYWSNALNNGTTIDSVEQSFLASSEYKMKSLLSGQASALSSSTNSALKSLLQGF